MCRDKKAYVHKNNVYSRYCNVKNVKVDLLQVAVSVKPCPLAALHLAC